VDSKHFVKTSIMILYAILMNNNEVINFNQEHQLAIVITNVIRLVNTISVLKANTTKAQENIPGKPQ